MAQRHALTPNLPIEDNAVTDRIYIKDLLVHTIIGVLEWEQQHVQELIFNIELAVDFKKAGHTDRIRDTLDYQAVIDAVGELVKKTRCYLIEKLATVVAQMILQQFKVSYVKIRIDKTSARMSAVKSVAVEIERNNE